MAEEAREVRGDQPNQLPAGVWIAFLCGSEQRFNSGGVGNPQPPAAVGEKLTMAVEQLDARQPQREFPGPVKLFAGQHYHSQDRAGSDSLGPAYAATVFQPFVEACPAA